MGALAGQGPPGNQERLFALVQSMAQLIIQGMALSTVFGYNRTLRHFRDFLLSLSPRYRPFSANAGNVCLYVTHLAQSGMAPATIAAKLSAISFVHKICQRPDPTASFLVKKLMAALHRARPQCDLRLPLSVDMLQRMLVNLPHMGFTPYQRIMLQSMLTLSFAAFLRPGEVTGNLHNITIHQVAFFNGNIFITALQSRRVNAGLLHCPLYISIFQK